MDTKMKQQSNRIELVRLQFLAGISSCQQYINIPFEVKKMRVCATTWDSAGVGTVAWITSDIPQTGVLCITGDTISSFKTYEFIYDRPITIQGTYTFSLNSVRNGGSASFSSDTGVILLLEFKQ